MLKDKNTLHSKTFFTQMGQEIDGKQTIETPDFAIWTSIDFDLEALVLLIQYIGYSSSSLILLQLFAIENQKLQK